MKKPYIVLAICIVTLYVLYIGLQYTKGQKEASNKFENLLNQASSSEALVTLLLEEMDQTHKQKVVSFYFKSVLSGEYAYFLGKENLQKEIYLSLIESSRFSFNATYTATGTF